MFTAMQEGTQEDWAEIGLAHAVHQRGEVPRKIMENLARLADMELGFAADQLTHSLMCATLARRAGASDEEVVAALCHDIGKLFSVPNHGPVAAEVLKPYVSDDIYQAIYWHQDFQGAHYYAFLGKDPKARERFRGEPWFRFRRQAGRRMGCPCVRSGIRGRPAGKLRAGVGAGLLAAQAMVTGAVALLSFTP